MKLAIVSVFSLALGLLTEDPALAQQSFCADCHFSRPDAPEPNHLMDWERSPHGRNNVGCEKCHGGDASTTEPFTAHRGVLHYSNPSSPVNRRNVSDTCGSCHVGPFTAFQNGEMYKFLQAGDRRVPVCTTCHDENAARLLSPKSLEAQCAECHGPGKVAPRPQRAKEARQLLEGVIVVREQLRLAQSFIKHIDDTTRRAELERQYGQAQVPLKEAVDAGHRFVYDDLQERLDVARKRVEALLAQLANPLRRP